jgi:pimeloyl-ACP methyl ester carboxylesterase
VSTETEAVTHTVTSRDGTTIAYERLGAGPSLVLVDGAMCYRAFGPCRGLAEKLADKFTVYFYDRRGRGESGDTTPYAPEREFEDLAAVIEAAGGSAFVFGFSSGGALALQAAASGVGMSKVASYEAPFVGEVVVKGKPVDALAQLNERLAAGDRAGAVNYFMVRMVGAPAFMPIVMKLMPKVFTQLKAIAHTLPYDTELMRGFVVPTEELAKVSIPALVMGGSKAKPNMRAAVESVAHSIPGSVQKTLQGQTHQVAPEAIAPELVAFFG